MSSLCLELFFCLFSPANSSSSCRSYLAIFFPQEVFFDSPELLPSSTSPGSLATYPSPLVTRSICVCFTYNSIPAASWVMPGTLHGLVMFVGSMSYSKFAYPVLCRGFTGDKGTRLFSVLAGSTRHTAKVN